MVLITAMRQNNVNYSRIKLSLQERVWDDVAVAMSFRQADRVLTNPSFPIVRWACNADLESSLIILLAVWRCPKKDRRRRRTVSDRNGCPVREHIWSLVTNADQCMIRIRLSHQLSSASIIVDEVTVTYHVSHSQRHIKLIKVSGGCMYIQYIIEA